jgi:hypothetical protein
MTEEQVLTPGEEGAGEAAAPTVPAAEVTPTPAPNADPLDDIKDEAARAEAKKFRAIARRQDKQIAVPSEPTPIAPSQDALAKVVTNQAKQLVSDEVRDNWDELSKIPLQGFDPMDAQSIAKNMAQRLAIFKSEQKPESGAEKLSQSPGIRGASPAAPSVKKLIPRLRDVDAIAADLYGSK